jgi:branched-chain amino acid transport system ATP-binding protein
VSLVLEIENVVANYGPIDVLFGMSLPVAGGKITAVLGPNGAGKTTTLKAAAGLVSTRSGSVRLDGQEIRGLAPRKVVAKGVCLIPEGRGIFPSLSVRDNLVLQSGLCAGGMSQVEQLAYEQFPVLGKRRKQIAGTLSGGEQQMLALTRALTSDPQVILIDEISMGLAPNLVERLFEVIRSLADKGKTIVLVEQLAEFAMEIADYVAVAAKGQMVALGEAADVRDQLTEIYLGGSGERGMHDLVSPGAPGLWVTPNGGLAHTSGCPVIASNPGGKQASPSADLPMCEICEPSAAPVAV